jgi:hypothetical protein
MSILLGQRLRRILSSDLRAEDGSGSDTKQ